MKLGQILFIIFITIIGGYAYFTTDDFAWLVFIALVWCIEILISEIGELKERVKILEK